MNGDLAAGIRRRSLVAAPALWLAAGGSPAQTPTRPARIGVLGSVPYDLHDLEPDQVEDFVRNGSWRGLNFTIPYKALAATPKAKAQWGEITDDEWTKAAGRRDEMVGLVQKRYGRAKDEAEREVDKWLAGL